MSSGRRGSHLNHNQQQGCGERTLNASFPAALSYRFEAAPQKR